MRSFYYYYSAHSPNVIARTSYTALVSVATTKKKRSFDAAFKLRVVAEQDTSRGAGRKFVVDERIVAALE